MTRRDTWSRWQTILATVAAAVVIMSAVITAGIKAGSLVFATKSDIEDLRLQLSGQTMKLNLLLMAYPIHNEARPQAIRKLANKEGAP